MSGVEDMAKAWPVGRVAAAHRDFLPAALEILETPANPAGRAVMGTIGAALVVAVVWASVGQVDIVATAPGSVIPAGRSKVVQPLEAGVLRAIRVEDGDHVAAGQVLFELDQTVAAADRDRIARDWRQARLDAAGLRALSADLAGDGFDRDRFVAPDGIPAAEIAIARAGIEARAREQQQKCQSLEQQIAQKDAETAENAAMVGKLAASLPILQQKRDLYRSLLNVAFTSKVAWLDSEQAYTDQLHQLAVQQSHGGQLVAARAALVAQLAQTGAGYAHDVLKDLAEAEQKAGELAQQYAAAAHKAGETVLTAPISGTVQALAVHTLGGVVTPAQALLTVVPDDGPVLIEATVENADIGFVHAGQDVEVKVRTFEFTRYGLLHGHVVDVSRDGVAEASVSRMPGDKAADPKAEDGKGNAPGYVAHVALNSARMMVDGQEETLSPGMAVTAEIKTGRRSVINYLLSPLRRYAHEGLQER
ncbi:HlyD family type I secretion periplasmic adaptor subunit [Rhodopila sp.]|uniref:HlyD family type I secretion periplasmic adaptor subunit n=1 Tax=Rhodopila sp. TaxID=2480087 RepID=UPI003D0C658B